MNKLKTIMNDLNSKIKKLKTKKNVHFLIITLVIIIILWLILYIIPETFASLFNTILGKIILGLLIAIISLHNILYGIIIIIILIIFYRFSNIVSKKEGFSWSPETLKKFLELQNTINRNLVFDTNITQKQASEKEVEYYLKNREWPWTKKVEKLYKEAISRNPYVRTEQKNSLHFAKSIYNQTAILELLALQTNEGKALMDGVEKYVPNLQQEEPPYAYNSGLLSRYNSIIQCNTDDRNNSYIEQKTTPPMGSLNAPTVIKLQNNNLESVIPGFKFIKEPCNPCSILNETPDYNCPFSIKTKNNPTAKISNVWKYLWNLNNETETNTFNSIKPKQSNFVTPVNNIKKISNNLNSNKVMNSLLQNQNSKTN
jgi:hypothetical protein